MAQIDDDIQKLESISNWNPAVREQLAPRLEQMRQAKADQESNNKQRQFQSMADQRAAAMAAAREQDMAKGRARGEELFKEGTLGRVRQDRSQDIQDVIAQRRANLQGFTPEEQNAMRENNLKTIQQSAAGNIRALRGQQAASGIRGATAGAQIASAQRASQANVADTERELFLKQMDAKRSALGAFEGSATQAEQNDLARQQYNQDQKNKELMSRISTEFGYANLGSGERAAAATSASATQASQAQADAAKKAGQK
jgi:hypothetical protein